MYERAVDYEVWGTVGEFDSFASGYPSRVTWVVKICGVSIVASSTKKLSYLAMSGSAFNTEGSSSNAGRT